MMSANAWNSKLIRSVKKLLPYVLWRRKRSYEGSRLPGSTSRPKSTTATPAVNKEDERIVITGISGRFPSANSMEEFQDKLLSGVDMTREQSERWKTQRLPLRSGFLQDLDKFDAEFFGIPPKLAEYMNPMQRKLLEVAFEAIIDAGLNPADLRGSRTGVYVGALGGETIDYNIYNGLSDEAYLKWQPSATTGFMLANRISFALDLRGTSLQISTGCSASLVALDEAVAGIRRGTCDAALVAASNALLSPDGTEAFMAMNALAPDGACKTFDAAANGFVRSEAAVAILIQRESAAKRHYATIRHVESNSDGYKDQGIFYPAGASQEALLRSAYTKAGVDPASVTYIECHGTGTPAGDPQEVQAIHNVFVRDVQQQQRQRPTPLALGSVKTNLGHTEYAAGLVGLAKVITCIQKGVIPGNLHFREANAAIRHLFGRDLKVANEVMEWKGGIVGISAFGLGGTNCHVILEPGPTEPKPSPAASATQLPVLFPFSGRSVEAVKEGIMRGAELGGDHYEVFSLLQHAFRRAIPGHSHRGFGIISMKDGEKGTTGVIQEEVCQVQEKSPSLWLVFPGMGCQWTGMGRDLMKFDPFSESIVESRRTLKNVGLDLDAILSSAAASNDSMFGNIRHAFVAITAVQVALYDLLTSMGLQPDGYLGHSAGEATCAYVDGCLSREEVLLVSEARGRAFLEGAKEGSMASVGLGLEEAAGRCPPQISISCHNSPSNVSISGSPENVMDFVQKLQADGIFARPVQSCGFAPHNKNFIGKAPELMEQYMREICPEPRPRSPKWISTSVPEKEWKTHPVAAYSSAEYFANNLLQPVLFQEATKHVPANAIVLEVAPRAYLQSLLKESLPRCIHVAPMSSSANVDKVLFFLSSVGKLHNSGLDVDLRALYPRTSLFPVPANVPCISPLIHWNHEDTWPTSVLTYPKRYGRTTVLDLNEPSLSYLRGHRLGHKNIFPAAGHLTLAWRAFAEEYGQLMQDFPVTFENVSFERATFLGPTAPAIRLKVSILSDCNGGGVANFVIREGETVVTTGRIKMTPQVPQFSSPQNGVLLEGRENPRTEFLTKPEVYKELRLRGYHYSGGFQGIEQISADGSKARVKWRDNWTCFLDAVLQTTLLNICTRSTLVPIRIDRLHVQPKELLSYINDPDKGYNEIVPLVYEKSLEMASCPGIELQRPTFTVVSSPSRQEDTLVYERYTFSALQTSRRGSVTPLKDITRMTVDLVKDNTTAAAAASKEPFITVVEIAPNPSQSLAGLILQGLSRTARRRMPRVTVVTLSCNAESVPHDLKSHSVDAVQILRKDSKGELFQGIQADLIVLHDVSMLSEASNVARNRDFILCRHDPSPQLGMRKHESLREVVSAIADDGCLYVLQRKVDQRPSFDVTHIPVNSRSFNWLPQVQSALQKLKATPESCHHRLYLTSQNDPDCGLLGLIKCLLREDPRLGFHLRIIYDPEGSLGDIDFQRPSKSLSKIVENDLVINVVKRGELGIYCHLPMPQGAEPGSLLKPVAHAHVDQGTSGDLGSLRWVSSPHNVHVPVDAEGSRFCTVAYAALNFKDLMITTGKLPFVDKTRDQDCTFGFEFSGVDSQGRRVMGLVPSRGLATSVAATDDFIFPVPESWSLEEAATVPVVYCTALWALFQRGKPLLPGQSLLVHSGTGGVGQAAINIALAHACEVFTTVGSPEKRACIKEIFPELRDTHIGSSRDCSFARQVMKVTGGRGVDVVLNSLAGEQLEASIRCLATDGKFLEIGATHAALNTTASALKYADFIGASLWKIWDGASQEEKRTLRSNFLTGLESGVVKPLPRTIFQSHEIEQAFRFMASGKHVGKILIDVRGDNHEKGGTRGGIGFAKTIRAVAKTYFHPEKIYVVIGGLGGLGLEVANWLINRGARHLVLPSRSGVTNGYQTMYLERWRARGATVETPKVDLSNYDNAERFVKSLWESNGGQTLGGVFNSTLVLRDNCIAELSIEDFEAVAAPKILITKHMDRLTREYCRNMDYFVTFSSFAAGLGTAAQANYGYANSAMERICEARVADGFHGLAIQWGVIRDVGFFEHRFLPKDSSPSDSGSCSSQGEERILGFRPQSIPSCLQVLDTALQQKNLHPVILSVVMPEREEGGGGEARKTSSDLLGTVARIFGIRDLNSRSPNTRLSELGMDSLIAAELKQTLERDFDFATTVKEMRSLTLDDLKRIETRGPLSAAPDLSPLHSGKQQVDRSDRSSSQWDLASLFRLHKDPLIKLRGNPSGMCEKHNEGTRRIFIVHGNIGNPVETFQALASKLECETFAFQFGKYSDLDRIHELARAYVLELLQVQPVGPYNICAYSGGGTVGFEMVQILESEYKAKVSNLIFLDGSCDWTEGAQETRTIMQSLLSGFEEQLAKTPETRKEEFYRSLSGDVRNNLATAADFLCDLGSISCPEEREKLRRSIGLYLSYHFRTFSYVPSSKFHGRVTLIRAAATKFFKDDAYNLQKHCLGPFYCHVVSGNHMTFLREDYVVETARILTEALLRARRGGDRDE